MSLTMKEAIELLEQGDWVHLRFITADLNRGTGGQVIELTKCRIARNRQIANVDKIQASDSDVKLSKKPNHNYNVTRNVELQNKQIRKIHLPLITHINSQPVI